MDKKRPWERPWERPPVVDADYRVVRGPWPRWALHMGLLTLALRTILIVTLLIGLAVAAIWAARELL